MKWAHKASCIQPCHCPRNSTEYLICSAIALASVLLFYLIHRSVFIFTLYCTMENNQAVEPVWTEASYGNAPPGSLVGGHDSTGEPIYVARAECREDLVPGKLIASKGYILVPWNGEEVRRYIYEVLVGSTNIWVPASGSKIPARTFAGGYTRFGEILYIGRVRHQGSITTGKVQLSRGLCYIAFDGQELSFSDYEVLTY